MFAGSATRDEFNFDAEAASFAYLASARGLTVYGPGPRQARQGVYRDADAPGTFVDFLRPRLEPYAPKDSRVRPRVGPAEPRSDQRG